MMQPFGYGGYGDGFGGLDFNALAQWFQPKSAQDIAGEMNAAHGMLPAALQLGAADTSPAAIAAAENRYRADVVKPSVEKYKADLAAEGRDNSTFGAAMLAQMASEGDRNAYYAGQDMVDRTLDRWAKKRGSYFGVRGGEGGLAVNDRGGAEMGQFITGLMNAQTNRAHAMNQDQLAYAQWNKDNGGGFMDKYGGVLGGLARGAINQAPNVWSWMKSHNPFGGGQKQSGIGYGQTTASGMFAPSTGSIFGPGSWWV
jgi:hypothetical protein